MASIWSSFRIEGFFVEALPNEALPVEGLTAEVLTAEVLTAKVLASEVLTREGSKDPTLPPRSLASFSSPSGSGVGACRLRIAPLFLGNFPPGVRFCGIFAAIHSAVSVT